MTMKIAVIDDYQNAFPTLKCYSKLKDHEVVIYTDTEKEPARLAERLKDAEAVVLTQQRSRFPRLAIDVGYRRATQDIGNIRSRQDWRHRRACGTDVRRAGALLGTRRLHDTGSRSGLRNRRESRGFLCRGRYLEFASPA